jgi:hypothetical protein
MLTAIAVAVGAYAITKPYEPCHHGKTYKGCRGTLLCHPR